MSLLIANVDVLGHGHVDVRVDRGVVVAIDRGLRVRADEQVLDGAGAALLPGLHDHHVHLYATAAAASSLRVGPPDVRRKAELAAVLRAASSRLAEDEWLRAVGYHESVAGLLDRAVLDEFVPNHPVRVQHRGGSLWILNSRAIALTGVEWYYAPGVERDATGRPTGRLWRMDRWLRDVVPRVKADLRALSRTAAAMGITGFTDATPDRSSEDVANLANLAANGTIRQRLHLMSPPSMAAPRDSDRVDIGPAKVMLDDESLPTVAELIDRVMEARRYARPVAVHCVTQSQLVISLAAFGSAGSITGDRIEHGSVIAEELIESIRQLGLTVVTQPNFIAERGDEYLSAVNEPESLYRCGSLLRAGVPTAAGTDAPFGASDPWAAMRAAVERRTFSGRILGLGERIAPMAALRLFLGHPNAPAHVRSVKVGVSADLCLLRVPLEAALRDLSASLVAATILGGEPT